MVYTGLCRSNGHCKYQWRQRLLHHSHYVTSLRNLMGHLRLYRLENQVKKLVSISRFSAIWLLSSESSVDEESDLIPASASDAPATRDVTGPISASEAAPWVEISGASFRKNIRQSPSDVREVRRISVQELSEVWMCPKIVRTFTMDIMRFFANIKQALSGTFSSFAG